MRLLLGIILGVILTVVVTYLYDASTGRVPEQTAQASIANKPVVNWDVVGSHMHVWSSDLRNAWHRLAAS